jgi:hypothetical protein
MCFTTSNTASCEISNPPVGFLGPTSDLPFTMDEGIHIRSTEYSALGIYHLHIPSTFQSPNSQIFPFLMP